MLKAKCIEKIRDKNNHIIGYKLIDKNKNEVLVKSAKLKEAIRLGQLDIINLTLTSDNRLVDKKPTAPSKPTTTHSKLSVEAVLAKARATGYNITSFDTDCGHKCYMASSPDDSNHILIIPDDVQYIYGTDRGPYIDNYSMLKKIEGNLKVIGGRGLISTYKMFTLCAVQSLDLTSLHTSKVTSMQRMFYKCKVQSIDLSSLDTSKVTTMEGMFFECEAKYIDLSSFDTSQVTAMNCMFYDCKAQSLDLTSFNTSEVINMEYMFYRCHTQSIALSSFDTSNVTKMNSMFQKCEAQSLDLSSFGTSKATNMDRIFENCKAQIKVNDSRLQYKLQSNR